MSRHGCAARMTVRLVLGAAVAAACSAAPAAPVRPWCPLYSWLFDDGNGTAAEPFTGSYEGLLEGGAVFDGTTTPLSYAGNSAVRLDGSNDLLSVAGIAATLEGLPELTLSLWVKSDAVGADRGIFAARSDGLKDNVLGLRYDQAGSSTGRASVIKLGVRNGDAPPLFQNAESSANVQTSDWQHLALTWTAGSNVKLYVNGQEDAGLSYNRGPIGGTLDADFFRLGYHPNAAPWYGRVDEAAVWDRALGAGEIEWLAGHSIKDTAAARYAQAVLRAVPLVYWRLNDYSPTTAKDASGAGRDAQFVGSGFALRQPGALLQDPDKSCRLSGSGSFLEDWDAPAYLDGLTALSVEVWVKADQTGVDAGIFSGDKAATGRDNMLGMRYDQQGEGGGLDLIKIAVSNADDEFQKAESSSHLQTTDWQYLAMTWSAGEDLKLYVNGQEDTGLLLLGNAVGGTLDVESLRLGWHAQTGDAQTWEGLLDEFALYDHVLSSAEIGEHYRLATTHTPEPATFVLLGLAALTWGLVRLLRGRAAGRR